VVSKRRRIRGRVVSLSEGGLAVVADLVLEQGDPIRILIDGRGMAPPLKVSAIVWNDSSASPSGREGRIRKLGCVVSDPSRAYFALLDSLDPKRGNSRAIPVPIPRARSVDPELSEPDLPRSRELQPPPKAEPEDSLPYFRIRLKQIGGPRTRVLTLPARSATQAERLALEQLDEICSGSAGWGVLHIARML
jgi:hypothetical protein